MFTPKKNGKSKVLFVSRPLVPPWSEANKNHAYMLSRIIKKYKIDTIGMDGIQRCPLINRSMIPKNSWTIFIRFKILIDLVIQVWKYDIVHIFLNPRSYSKAILKFIFYLGRVKIVQNLHCEPIRGETLDSILFGDLTIVHSEYREKQLKMAGFENVKRIDPGIEIDKLYPKKNVNHYRELWNIKDETIVLYAGSYRNDSDMEIILNTIKKVTDKLLPIKLIMACRIRKRGLSKPHVETNEPENEANFKRKANKLGIDKHIIYLETVIDMHSVIAASDICLFPITKIAERADLPMVIIESMSQGKAILMSNLSPYSEVLKYGGGITVSNSNVDQFVNNLIKLHYDEKLRRLLGEEGKRVAREYFNIKRLAIVYEELYSELLE